MSSIITHNKLVQDRIPEIIEVSGKHCSIGFLTDETYLQTLYDKLDEELAEYHADQNPEDLAVLL